MQFKQLFKHVFTIALFCISFVPGFAQVPGTNPPPIPGAAAPTYAPVKLDGRTLFELMGTSGLSAAERADKVNRRLLSLVSRDEPLPLFSRRDIATHSDETTILIDGDTILAVTDADAQDALTTRDDLALLWGQKMVSTVNDEYTVHANFISGAGILIRNSISDFEVSTIKWLPKLAGALVILAVFSLIGRLNLRAIMPLIERAHFDSNRRHLVRTVVYHGTWGIGLLAALSTLGLNSASLAATIGISGIVLGFGFKDILSHLFAGFMLLLGSQFHVGDQIVVKEFEGTVERIELRALYLRTYDNRLVIIPNGDVFTSAVISNTDSAFRRREFIVRISYQDNLERALSIALEAIGTVDGVAEVPTPDILVDELALTTVNLKVRFYTHSQRADYLRVGSQCMAKVKEAFESNNMWMPSDIQSLSIENLDKLVQPRTITHQGS